MIHQILPLSSNGHSRMFSVVFAILCLAIVPATARQWRFIGIADPQEAEFVGMQNGAVVLQGPNGKCFELPIERFSPADQQYLRALQTAGESSPAKAERREKPLLSSKAYQVKKVEKLSNQVITLSGAMEYHVTGEGDPAPGCAFVFTSPDAWLFFQHVKPSAVASSFLGRMRVDGKPGEIGINLRVEPYGSGSVVIPHDPDFPAMTFHAGKSLSGGAVSLKPHVKHDASNHPDLNGFAGSFLLKRGYMATIAENADGTGISRNFVAQDHDIVVDGMPAGWKGGPGFVRIFPWRWTTKKGVAGNIWKNLNVGWFYDWSASQKSSADMEYVPIRQNRHWPGLDLDWKEKGAIHLLGFNEPDRPDQAKMTVDEALSAWPLLLRTGLRLGSPAVSDGGLNWLYQFMDKADAANLRVDFVAVHYYRATADPKDAKGAAAQFKRFLTGIHDRVKRPIWITEWNNGANWTTAPDPNPEQQKDAIREMIAMLEETEFVERYAIYNWVEEVRNVQKKDGALTPAGEIYRNQESSLSHVQARWAKQPD